MTNDEIRRMMELVDEQFLDELTDDLSTEKKPDITYTAGGSEPFVPAEEVGGETPVIRRSPWRTLAAIAAAVVIVAPMGYLAVQGQKNFRPADSVEQISETMPPDDWADSFFDGTLDVFPDIPQNDAIFLMTDTTNVPDLSSFLTCDAIEIRSGTNEYDPPSEAVLRFYKTDSDTENYLELRILDHTDDPLAGTNGKPLGDAHSDVIFHGKNENGVFHCAFHSGDTQYLMSGTGFDNRELITFVYEVLASQPTVFSLMDTNVWSNMTGTEEVSIEEADRDTPWQGKLLTLDKIGAMERAEVERTNLLHDTKVYDSESISGRIYIPTDRLHDTQVYDMTTLSFRDPDSKGLHQLALMYLPIEAADFDRIDAQTLNSGMLETGEIYHQHGDTMFGVDYGTYAVRIFGQGCTTEEIGVLIDALRSPAASEQALVEGEDSRYLTYEEAKALVPDDAVGKDFLPDRVLGTETEEFPTILTLDESCILYTQHTAPDETGMLATSEWLTLEYHGVSDHHLTVTIGLNGEVPTGDVPEIDGWSMKLVTAAPAAVTLEAPDPVLASAWVQEYDFCVRNEDMTVAVHGKAAMGEIDQLANFFSQAFYQASTGNISREYGLEDVHSWNTVWKDAIPALEQIGQYDFTRGDLHRFESVIGDKHMVTRQNLYYTKSSASDGVVLSYTDMTPDELYYADKVISADTPDAAELCNDDRFLADDRRIFVMDLGDYRICVTMPKAIAQEDVQAVLDAIAEART